MASQVPGAGDSVDLGPRQTTASPVPARTAGRPCALRGRPAMTPLMDLALIAAQLRRAIQTFDLDKLAPCLAPDVRWTEDSALRDASRGQRHVVERLRAQRARGIRLEF